MFTDYVKIEAKAGKGGNGAISFRREKYVAAGRTRPVVMAEMVEASILKLTKIVQL